MSRNSTDVDKTTTGPSTPYPTQPPVTSSPTPYGLCTISQKSSSDPSFALVGSISGVSSLYNCHAGPLDQRDCDEVRILGMYEPGSGASGGVVTVTLKKCDVNANFKRRIHLIIVSYKRISLTITADAAIAGLRMHCLQSVCCRRLNCSGGVK